MNAFDETTSKTKGKTISKRETFNLTKEMPSLKKVNIGLGWDVSDNYGDDSESEFDLDFVFDLDVCALLVDENGNTKKNNFVFYGSKFNIGQGLKCDPAESVIHVDDSKIGTTDTDGAAQFMIDLDRVPDNIQKIVIACSIYDANKRHQALRQLENAYINLVDQAGNEVLRYRFEDNFNDEIAAIVAEINKTNGEWEFTPVDVGYRGGLVNICAQYGLEIV